ncbi:hypothetical protein RIF29_33867 [Crotalaria pallida]|uniref:Uncharacterized protein n=1 Tax=Crotalaria pallida TaxID=3830 RepID=A0AAN9E8K1_CROPI
MRICDSDIASAVINGRLVEGEEARKFLEDEYCNKVYSAKAKYHGIEGAESKPRSWPCDGAKFRRWNPILRMDAHANIHVKNDTKILNQIKKSIRVLRAAANTKKGSNNIPLEHFLGYMWRLSECSHSCTVLCAEKRIVSHLLLRGEQPEILTGYNLISTIYGNVHYYVQSHIQINEYRDRVILPSASKKHRRPITTFVKVLDMTGL